MIRGVLAAASMALLLLVRPAFGADSLKHFTLLESPARPFPTRLVLLPPDVAVKEISAGGIMDPVPEWTELANANIKAELRAQFADRPEFSLVDAPEFSAEEKARLEDFQASYMVVGATAHWATTLGGGEWAHKRNHFDYTLGEGLAFVREKTGADAAVMVIGEDHVSSSGRKAAMIVGAMLGVGIVGGASAILVGVVDLNNGDILWMHFDRSGIKDLKDRESVKAMMTAILATLPVSGGKLALR